jgi:hypothetical protein
MLPSLSRFCCRCHAKSSADTTQRRIKKTAFHKQANVVNNYQCLNVYLLRYLNAFTGKRQKFRTQTLCLLLSVSFRFEHATLLFYLTPAKQLRKRTCGGLSLFLFVTSPGYLCRRHFWWRSSAPRSTPSAPPSSSLAPGSLKGLCHDMNNFFEGPKNQISTFCICVIVF